MRIKVNKQERSMPSDIILIGPIGAGKSTLGERLLEKLGVTQCSMDERRWDYYRTHLRSTIIINIGVTH